MEQLEEKPLSPLVVIGQRGHDLPVPVVHRADALQLPAHVLDIPHGPQMGVNAVLDGCVLGGEPEGVETHGVEDVVALHALETGVDVRGGHSVPVADVQVPGGVREHGQLIPLGLVGVFLHAVQPVLDPPLLPLGLYFRRVVSEGH